MIEVLAAGMQTTVQDLGRTGYMHLGISHSGVMDQLSAVIANRLLGVKDDNPVLECTQIGPDLKFHQPMKIALAGANMCYELNGKSVKSGEMITVGKDSVLKFKGNRSGCRLYMAFDKQLAISPIFGSVATQLNATIGGYQGRALVRGDVLDLLDIKSQPSSYAAPELAYHGHYQIRFTKTPEWSVFSPEQLTKFQADKYHVSNQFSRMGIRLSSSNTMKFDEYPHMVSRGLLPGAIQIPPDGVPIIAAMDAQTTGGYVRIGQVIQADMPIIGQLKATDVIQFQQISIEQALQLKQQQQQLLDAAAKFHS